jgi:cephalosporin hydroxylase
MIQEVIVDHDVELVIECGTNQGGSAFYVATIFDALDREGHVVTIDIESMVDFTHPRITFLTGSSVDRAIVEQVREIVARREPARTLVILDSDHTASHVLAEARSYAEFVTVGDYMLVQDGAIDELRSMRHVRPGPLVAVGEFLRQDSRFEIDRVRSEKYLTAHSPSGWLRRVR